MPTTTARKPREFILSVAKDGVVGARVFSAVRQTFNTLFVRAARAILFVPLALVLL